MTTNTIDPKIIYNNIIETSPTPTLYNYNVPVDSELEIVVEFVDANGNDISGDITYVLTLAKSMGALLFDTNTISVTWVGAGSLPAVNKLTMYRKTSDVQQTVYNYNADISVETALEVDRLTRAQQDAYSKLDDLDTAIEVIEGNINPIINTIDIADGAVTEPKLAANSVTSAKIASNSVTSDKIASAAVTGVELAANSVSTSKVVNGAITEDKIANGSISVDKIAANAVTSDKILNAAITESKLAQDVLDKFDQNIPFKFSVSTFSPTRLRIESAEIVLNDSSSIAASTGSSLITFDGMEIDFVSGDTYDLNNNLTGSNVFTFPTPSAGQYVTYLIQAAYGSVNALGKTPLTISTVIGQQNAVLGQQSFPELGLNQDLSIGYITVQESGGSLAPLEDSKLVTIDCNSNQEPYNNIARIRVASHLFTVGDKLIPVYWNGLAWTAADGSDVQTLATHLILEVISNEEFTIAYSGRIFMPNHGLNVGAYYFLGEATGVLDLLEADDFSNPILQVETSEYFTLLGWRANEKSITNNIAGVDRVITNLVASTPTTFTSSLAILYSVQVYDTVRKRVHDEIEVRLDDINPNKFTLFSSTAWLDLRVDLVGVK